MVEAGRARAASLGWPDAYAYTKALGERALLQNRGDVPVSIVRPSIIESALAEPCPGWIRGFRMAEPVIISYARGLLKEFPGVPEGIVDVIPVDLVVGRHHRRRRRRPARRARRSPRWRPARSTRCATATSSTWCSDVLHRAPALRRRGPADHRARVVVPRPRPGAAPARAGQERHRPGRAACCQTLPLRGKQAAWAATLEEKREEVERALAYVELYGAYAECEAIYGVDRLLARWDAPRPRRPGRRSASTPGSSTGTDYAPDVHLPSVVEHARVRTTPGGRTGENREDRLRRQVLAPARHFAAFDLENTLIASNVVASYSWLATRRLPPRGPAPLRAADAGARRRRCSPPTGATAATSSATSTAATTGADVDQLDADAVEMFSDLILTKSFPAAIRRVREHRAPRAPHRADHRRPRPRHRAAAPAVRRHRVRPRSPAAPTAPTAAS